jgi:hypothetical protein
MTHACPLSSLQTPAPSQVALAPHSASGSFPGATKLHTPLTPPDLAALQATQVPPHATSQHTPSTHKPVTHSLAAAQLAPLTFLHEPEPSQLVPAAHSASGSVAVVTKAQVPLLAPVLAAVHAMQVAPQALLQHTPSTQKPLAHSLAAVHAVPLTFLATHWLALQ